jgi:hypothetical protein
MTHTYRGCERALKHRENSKLFSTMILYEDRHFIGWIILIERREHASFAPPQMRRRKMAIRSARAGMRGDFRPVLAARRRL